MRSLFLAAILVLCGCAPSSPPVVRVDAASVDPWVLTWTDPRDETPALLWNGLIGVRIGRSGAGLNGDSMPLPFFAIEEYDSTGEEKIRPLPNPLVVVWELDEHRLSPGDMRNYEQTLNMRTGVLTTTYQVQLPAGNARFQCQTVLHPSQRQISQRWVVTPEENLPIAVETLIVSPTFASLHRPVGTPEKSIYEYAPSGAKALILQQVRGGQDGGAWTSTEKGFVWSGKIPADKAFVLDRTVSLDKRRPSPAGSFTALQDESAKIWAERWKTDIEIDGPAEDQQAVRSFLFYLRSAINPDGGMSISPFGLSSERYGGHVFWDADIWVFPALALVDPAAARAIVSFRVKNVAKHVSVPWEASLSGKEISVQNWPQIHVTGSVAFGVRQAHAFGLVDDRPLQNILKQARLFYRLRSSRPERQNDWVGLEIHDVVSPDENFRGNNDLYTNLLAQWSMRGGTFEDPFAGLNPPGFKLPKDDQTFLSYDNDPVLNYKQAAAVLSIYPLQYPPAETQATKMLNRFEGKIDPAGPPMSDSIHAIIHARFGNPNRGYEVWKRDWQPFTDHPLLLFSEKRTSAETYFTTGAGGSLQSVIYGFLGFRIDTKQEPGAVWSKKLHGGRWLSVKPHLPMAWKKVTFRNFEVLGERYTLTVTHTSARVTKGAR